MTATLRRALLPALLFWAGWVGLHAFWPQSRPLALAGQLWLAYSAAGCTSSWRWWPLAVPLASALGAAAGLWLLPGIGLVQWLDPGALWRPWLPAFAFALLMHLPLRWWRWREEQAVTLRLALAEQTAAMAELSRQVSVAELKALQAQVEPHFLFNALASLQQLIRSQPATAERFLGELHNYLRLALPTMREPLSTVERELALARAYLTVMATRLGARLQVQVHAARGCESDTVPPMMLLTLVENAARHGIEPLPQGGCVDVQARREAGRLVLEVCDSGAGLQPGGASQGQGVGLANVRDRLASLYAGEARLILQQRGTGGVSARIELPAPS